jgi:hypothetical protein
MNAKNATALASGLAIVALVGLGTARAIGGRRHVQAAAWHVGLRLHDWGAFAGYADYHMIGVTPVFVFLPTSAYLPWR